MSMNLQFSDLASKISGQTFRANEILYHGKSDFQTIDVVDVEGYGRMLVIDGIVMTTEKDEFFYHEMIVHVPMNSHPNPESVLVIGGGDGGVIREVLKHPEVKRVVLCEIDRLVIDVSKKYLPTISCKLDDPRVDIQVRDGIKYIAQQKSQFDVIIIDSTDPLGPGTGLFTEEFYRNVNAALKPGGIMTAQTESPVANKKEVSMIYPLLRKAFPIVESFVGPVPTYPGVYWCWSFCSNTVHPLDYVNTERANELAKTLKVYNVDIHRACFALPNFVRELTK